MSRYQLSQAVAALLVVVELVPACAGGSEQKNGQSDLGILLAAFMLNANGDLNGDMMTTQQDLGILLANFGAGCR